MSNWRPRGWRCGWAGGGACLRPGLAKGLCLKHYDRMRYIELADRLPEQLKPQACKVEGCEIKSRPRLNYSGYCSYHVKKHSKRKFNTNYYKRVIKPNRLVKRIVKQLAKQQAKSDHD